MALDIGYQKLDIDGDHWNGAAVFLLKIDPLLRRSFAGIIPQYITEHLFLSRRFGMPPRGFDDLPLKTEASQLIALVKP